VSALRSARERDGRPVLSGLGARLTKRGLRVEVLVVTHPVKPGKVRMELHDGGVVTKRVTITVASPGLEPGFYQGSTLEVAT
jgi:hypothetical protein